MECRIASKPVYETDMMEFIRNIVIGGSTSNPNHGTQISPPEVYESGSGERCAMGLSTNNFAQRLEESLFVHILCGDAIWYISRGKCERVCREDNQVSYGFVAKQGRRGSMEDFTYAQVSVHKLGLPIVFPVLPTQPNYIIRCGKRKCPTFCSLEDAATASNTDSLVSLMDMEALQQHLL